jgi:short-subunit dehydrogenase
MSPAPRCVVISGASSGLGAALAGRYAAPGVHLGLLGRDADRLESIGRACIEKGAEVTLGRLDVRDAPAVAEWLQQLDAARPITTLIAAAGISAGVEPGTAAETTDLARRQIETNLLGAMNTISPIIPLMGARGRGAIGVISSVAGLRGLPYSPGYSASKAGVRAFGEALRPLLQPSGVRVTVVTPGFFDTPMTDRWQGSTPFLWSVEKTAKAVQTAVDRGDARLSFPWPLTAVMKLADLAPPWIIDPILRGFRFHILPPT